MIKSIRNHAKRKLNDFLDEDFRMLSNISNMRRSVSLPDETPRRELKIRRAAEYF